MLLKLSKILYNFSSTSPKGYNLYTWSGALGSDLIPRKLTLTDPSGKELNNKITKVRLGQGHNSLITTEGHLYTWGTNNYGCLGHNDNKQYEKPKLLEFFVKKNLRVIDVGCGDNFTIALTHDGDVWTWGFGGKQRNFLLKYLFQDGGPLGHGDQKHHFTPQPVLSLRKLPPTIQISCGVAFCNALTKEKDLFQWGRGQHGIFGDGIFTEQLKPRLNQYFTREKQNGTTIEKIKSCNYYSIAKLSNGKIVGWGSNDFGQMGIQNEIGVELHETAPFPANLHMQNFKAEIEDFKIGEDVLVVKLLNNQIYYSGMKIAYLPKLFDLPKDVGKIKCFGASYRSFAVVDENNQIYMFNKFMKHNKEDVHSGIYFADNKLFNGGNIGKIGGVYRNNYALVEEN
ncbi:regulator of chromosome condensation protein, putative [Ichthyophthirius multifiliis]|uniref:Regulator of chromosome condensation protein, putative n=1 Tax=Ichthyophthirius multifiliis TaxID=5932 RepID=G0QQT1_ICHMU|nr:regulator of chromosome condensation protein, putative [Ichthyophthirius multifiliis]EGR32423.1 regulator of chromosome condensation protein, putative [Ichthyophthirius multifiliis]|eukprot:XP_004036409.1 regulator of chromosome condensation protein, putative [Ichthyophthirius multifiliis]